MVRLASLKLGKDGQISYRSTPEIVARLDLATANLAALKVTMLGKKLRTGHVVNAISLWLGSLDPIQLKQFMAPKIRQLEAYLDAPEGNEVRPGDKLIEPTDPKPGGKGAAEQKPEHSSGPDNRSGGIASVIKVLLAGHVATAGKDQPAEEASRPKR